MLNINFYEIIFMPIFVFLVSLFFFKKIIDKFKYLIKLNLVLQFSLNKISFNDLKRIFLIYDYQINKCDFQNFQDVVFEMLKINVESFSHLNEIYDDESNNFSKFCEECIANSTKILLLISYDIKLQVVKI